MSKATKPSIIYTLLTLFSIFIFPVTAHAYIGPGAGLGMLGSIVVLIVTIIVAIFGIIFYPLKLLINLFKSKNKKEEEITIK